LSRRLLSRFQLGLEYNPAAGEVGPIATAFVLTEQGHRPALFVGTSSDRIGSPEGTQSYYATASRSLGGLPVSVYGTVNWSEWDDGINFPFGAYVEIAPGVTVQPMYDGQRTHALATYARERFSVTVIYAWLERAGIAASVGF
jgi:hypothetical protein